MSCRALIRACGVTGLRSLLMWAIVALSAAAVLAWPDAVSGAARLPADNETGALAHTLLKGEGQAEGAPEGELPGEGEGQAEGASEGELAGEGEVEGEVPVTIIHVDRDRPLPGADGLTWATAFPALQSGIDAAQAAGGGEVWVAEGRYDELRSPNGTLFLRAAVSVYGGFTGDEADRDERDWSARRTVIDGFTSNNGNPASPVVFGANDAMLDGFTVQRGRGITGAGMLNNGTSPVLRNCVFVDNRVTQFGGGMYNLNEAAPRLYNCVFYNNRADIHGGAIANESSSPLLVGCTISENSAPFRGAGLFNNVASNPSLVNCIVWGNDVEQLGSTGTSLPLVRYSIVQGSFPGEGNLDADPFFRNPSIGNFSLRPGSLAIDQGRDTSQIEFGIVTRDIEGDLRGFDGDGLGFSTADGSDFDMGADEFTGSDTFSYHTADTSEDLAISLSELLRIVQFFNSGKYHCVFGTEDGFAPGVGSCPSGFYHDSDYTPGDYTINITELLRMVQFYNAPFGYDVDPGSEDGYKPVFGP